MLTLLTVGVIKKRKFVNDIVLMRTWPRSYIFLLKRFLPRFLLSSIGRFGKLLHRPYLIYFLILKLYFM